MKKVGSSFKKLGGFFLILVILYFLFRIIFSSSREGFKCAQSSTCIYNQDTTCTSGKGQQLTCQPNGTWGK